MFFSLLRLVYCVRLCGSRHFCSPCFDPPSVTEFLWHVLSSSCWQRVSATLPSISRYVVQDSCFRDCQSRPCSSPALLLSFSRFRVSKPTLYLEVSRLRSEVVINEGRREEVPVQEEDNNSFDCSAQEGERRPNNPQTSTFCFSFRISPAPSSCVAQEKTATIR